MAAPVLFLLDSEKQEKMSAMRKVFRGMYPQSPCATEKISHSDDSHLKKKSK